MKKYLLFYLLLSLTACDRIDTMVEEDDQEFEVTVLGYYADCNLVQLAFRAEDASALKQITSVDGTTYHAVNYSKILFQTGQKLSVKVRKLTDDELPACPALGPAYPALSIIKYRVLG